MKRQNGSKSWILVMAMVLVLGALLSACGSNKDAAEPAASNAVKSDESASAKPEEKVVLKMYHWIGADAGPVVDEINKKFTEAYPNITVDFESAPTDQYATVIKTKIAANDAPDIFGAHPGAEFTNFAKAGVLLDLSDQTWNSRVTVGAKAVMTYDNKLYGLPTDQNAVGVIYNKKIFADLGIALPTNWDEFLAACEKIKASKLIPLALGNKDLWVTQLIPLAMAPTAINRDTPDFEKQLFSGKATFAASAWTQMLQDYVDLGKKGYFNEGSLGTSYDQTVQMIASGKAAMMVNGNWALAPIKQANPDIDLGMFALPYAKAGEKVWTGTNVGSSLVASSKSKHPEEVKKYIEFWSKPEIMSMYLTEKKAFSAFTDVSVEIDRSAKEMEPYIQVGSAELSPDLWPTGVQDVMFKHIQDLFANGISIEDALKDMDKKFQETKDK